MGQSRKSTTKHRMTQNKHMILEALVPSPVKISGFGEWSSNPWYTASEIADKLNLMGIYPVDLSNLRRTLIGLEKEGHVARKQGEFSVLYGVDANLVCKRRTTVWRRV